MRFASLAIGVVWAAIASADVLYRLPWVEGQSFRFTQVPGSRSTTHFTKATLNAVDIAMPEGTPVVAAREGVVEALEWQHGASPEEEPLTYEGNFVRVRHADGTTATYAHLRHRGPVVAPGEAVAGGQLIGYSGASGDVEEAHLHFAVSRHARNSAGWLEEISLPVTFYVGVPALAFKPRAGQRVAAVYAGAAVLPPAAAEGPLVPWKRPALVPGDEARAWSVLALWLAFGAAGMAGFWLFARR